MRSLFSTHDPDDDRRPRAAAGANPLVTLWRQKWIFLGVFVVVVAAAVAALVTLPARFYASGSLIVAEPESRLSNNPPNAILKAGDPADVESQLLVVRSSRVMRLVLARPGIVETIRDECRQSQNLITRYVYQVSCTDLDADGSSAIDYLQNRYTIGGAGRSRVITVGYTSRNPQTARMMANALIDAVLQDHLDGISEGREVAIKGLNDELSRLDTQIRSDDAKIQAFRSSKGLTNGAAGPLTAERLSNLSGQLAVAEASRSQAAATIAAVKASGTAAAASLPSISENRAVVEMKERLSGLQGQVAAAAMSLGPRHPTIRTLEGQIASARAGLERALAGAVETARKQYDVADRTVASLQAELDSAKVAAASANSEEASIEQMVRDLGVKKSQYSSSFDQRKSLESEQKALLGSTRLVSMAELPDRKYFPKTAPFVGGGVALGLILAAGAALLAGNLRRPQETVGEAAPVAAVPSQVPSPLLARLPAIRGAVGLRAKLIEADRDPGMQIALQQVLDSVLGPSRHVGAVRSLVVLSAFTGEGKTFTTLALAHAALKRGARVLVVEADMRRPLLARTYDADDKTTSLAGILSAPDWIEPRVAKTDLPWLDIIPGGEAAEGSPTELLMAHRLTEFLDWAETYDLVLIDGPALERQMDAGILSCRADGFLFCVQGDALEDRNLVDVSTRLTGLGARSLGFVVTPAVNERWEEADPPRTARFSSGAT
jgi:uncharacterized protein involved in exopolysaccharide biosynthesis/Mrp family chromosome partitioning ATPase